MFQLYRAIIRPFLRTVLYPITSTFGIPSVYSGGVFVTYTVCSPLKLKKPDDGSVELKHVALNVSLTINKKEVDVFD
jgi:hypothetical protein